MKSRDCIGMFNKFSVLHDHVSYRDLKASSHSFDARSCFYNVWYKINRSHSH